jgi:exopolysaccharide production protein ExoZ
MLNFETKSPKEHEDPKIANVIDPVLNTTKGSPSGAQPAGEMVMSIQLLRGLAAVSVVIFHAALTLKSQSEDSFSLAEPYVLSRTFLCEILMSGVDVFFIISGFIMVYTVDRFLNKSGGAVDFLKRRIIRIVPAYWIVYLYLVDHYPYILFKDYVALAKSVFFIPQFNESGLVHPMHGVGWTLQYEMFFYAMFAIAILGGRKRYLAIITAEIGGVLILANILRSYEFDGAFIAFLSDSVIIEFLFGCFLAWGLRNGWRVSRRCGIAVIAASLILFCINQYAFSQSPRLWCRGIPSLVLVSGALAFDYGRFRRSNMFTVLGDASYSIYLIHTILLWNWVREPLSIFGIRSSNGFTTDAIILLSTLACSIVGIIFFWGVERPLFAFCRRQFIAAQPNELSGI